MEIFEAALMTPVVIARANFGGHLVLGTDQCIVQADTARLKKQLQGVINFGTWS